jgi:hypothetical protein
MAGIIKVNQYQDFNGNTILTSDGSGNLTTQKTNYPAFEVYVSPDQSLSDNVNTKIQFNQITYDTGGYYDNTTNYRYTPLVAGKYYFYAQVLADALGGSDLRRVQLFITKNGTNIKSSSFMMETYRLRQATPFIAVQIEMNGTTDYVEAFTQIDDNSGTPNIESGVRSSAMGGYRIGS